jgi:hypothetical protein
VKLKLTYYGQNKRDFDLEKGDLLKWVLIDGRQGQGLLVDFELSKAAPLGEELGSLIALRVLTEDAVVVSINKSSFFRLRVLNRGDDSQ